MMNFEETQTALATIHTIANEARKTGDKEAVEECVHYAGIVISGEWPEGFYPFDFWRYIQQLSAEVFERKFVKTA